MFKHTVAIFTKTIDDFLTVKTFLNFAVQVIYMLYLAYLLINPTDIWYLHAALLTVSFAFLIFDIIITVKINEIKSRKPRFWRFLKKKKYKAEISKAKKTRAVGKKVNLCASHTIKLFVLISAIYPIVISPHTVQPISIISTAVMILLWILQILFEILMKILIQRMDLFIEAIKADFEFVTKPVDSVKNTFRKFMGKDVKDEREPTKERTYLDSVVEKFRAKKAEEKNENKAEHGERLSDWLDSYVKGFKRKSSPVRKGDDTIVLSADEVEDKSEV